MPSKSILPCKGLAFASDFDGTLYWRNRAPHFASTDIDAIRNFRRLGGLFGLSTGRSFLGITELARDFPLDVVDFFVLASGANVRSGSYEPIAVHSIDAHVADAIWDQFIDRTGIVIQANDTVYTLVEPLPSQIHVDRAQDIEGSVYGLSFGTGSIGLAHELAAEVNRDYGHAVAAFPNECNVDIAPCGCSKGVGLATIRNRFAVRRLGAIGDSYNDIAMVDEADAFFTFYSSPSAVQAYATRLVDSVAEALALFSQSDVTAG